MGLRTNATHIPTFYTDIDGGREIESAYGRNYGAFLYVLHIFFAPAFWVAVRVASYNIISYDCSRLD